MFIDAFSQFISSKMKSIRNIQKWNSHLQYCFYVTMELIKNLAMKSFDHKNYYGTWQMKFENN